MIESTLRRKRRAYRYNKIERWIIESTFMKQLPVLNVSHWIGHLNILHKIL